MRTTTSYGTLDRLMSGLALSCGALPIVTAVGFRLANVDLTGRCRFQQLLGFPAPSCGLTRSFVALVGGDLERAAAYHLFGPVLFVLFAVCAMQGLCEVSLQRRLPYGYRWAIARPHTAATGGLLASACFFLYYGIRLYARYHLSPADFSIELIQGLIAGAQRL